MTGGTALVDPGGLATYTEALRTGRLTEATLRTTLQTSDEYRQRFGTPASVVVNPQLWISPSAGPRGTTFSQPGQGFTPNSTATVYYRKPDGVLYPPVKQPTDGQGRYTRQWTAPPEAQTGTYQAWAVDDRTGRKSPIISYTLR